jgi:hypothetical protein
MNQQTKLGKDDFRSTLPRFTPQAMKADMAKFNKRRASNEFAGSVSNPYRHTLRQTK